MTERQVTQARQMRNIKMTYAEIGRELGVTWHTVFRWLHPDYHERQRLVAKRRNRSKVSS